VRGEETGASVTFYLRFCKWALIWDFLSFDAMSARSVIARLQIREHYRTRWGWLVAWDEKPDWKHFPTNGALCVEHTSRGKNVAYVFRGPIERISVSTV
jgi:hypothetical protein